MGILRLRYGLGCGCRGVLGGVAVLFLVVGVLLVVFGYDEGAGLFLSGGMWDWRRRLCRWCMCGGLMGMRRGGGWFWMVLSCVV